MFTLWRRGRAIRFVRRKPARVIILVGPVYPPTKEWAAWSTNGWRGWRRCFFFRNSRKPAED